MLLFFYSLAIRFYATGIAISAWWNEKAKKFISGRKDLWQEIKSRLQPDEYRVWFHCASVGEFEQARPVLERYREKFPSHKIILTFFSPSGYELRKNYAGADYVFYLPIDTKKNAYQFLDLVKPRFIVFVKYDLWWNFLDEIFRRKIPCILISAIFKKHSWLFSWYGNYFLKKLNGFSHIFLQDENSLQLLQENAIQNGTVAGDTRFDRVTTIAINPKKLPIIEAFRNGQNLFVAGSTWKEDENILLDFTKASTPGWKFIVVPHEIDEAHLNRLKNFFDEIIFYSEANEKNVILNKIMIIDQIGFLSSVYQYAKIAYVGGGFGRGIHNILEAAVYGIPVFFGPNFTSFNEACDLVKRKGAFSIQNTKELQEKFTEVLMDYDRTAAICKDYVQQNTGATSQIISWISAKAQNGAEATA